MSRVELMSTPPGQLPRPVPLLPTAHDTCCLPGVAMLRERGMSQPDETSADIVEFLNSAEGWTKAMGLRLTRATRDEVCAELEVGPEHLQLYGIVHGGVHSGIVETLASVGAGISVFEQGKRIVGLENHTSFIRAVGAGKLRARATPLTRGRRSQVWECEVRDEAERLVSTGRVRLLVLEEDAKLAPVT
jgi:1,4-dihydroxy-2-naphthoyl-CoA hydrolase